MHPIEDAEAMVERALPRRGPWRRMVRMLGWTLFAVYLLFGLSILFLRYIALPKVGNYRSDIERYASRVVGQRITIGSIEAGWQGLRPELFLRDVTLHDHENRPALALPRVEATIGWASVVFGAPRFYSLVFDHPQLEIRRDKAGALHVAGMELHAARTDDPGIVRLLLAQREIAIQDAGVTWIDEQRRAPPLALSEVNMVLRDGYTHRFSMSARAPAALASALKIQGELRGGRFLGFSPWRGTLSAQLGYADLAAWQQWVDYPFEVQSGKGAVRLSVEFAEGEQIQSAADVELSGVVTRLREDLPPFEIESLRGRLGASVRGGKRFEVFGTRLTLTAASGVSVPPADFRVRWQAAEPGTPRNGEVEINSLQLEPLARIAEFLPLPQAVRERLAATEPRGNVSGVRVAWTDSAAGISQFKARGSFGGLAARANDGIPGFAGLTGRFEASESGGNVALGAEDVAVDLPGVLPENPVRLDSLSGRVSWALEGDRLDVTMSGLQLANSDLAGTFSGSYQSRREGAGFLDVTGNLTRGQGRAAYRYIPFLPPPVTAYLKESIREGRSEDVSVRFRGDLSKFPFPDSTAGIFRIAAKVTDAEVRFAEGWPAAKGVTGDLVFEGSGMRIDASRAGTLDLVGNSVKVVVPDLYHGDEHIKADIRAEDQTQDFLDFIARSPVAGAIDGVTNGMRASGVGRLALQVDIPLRRPEKFSVAGEYRMVNNDLSVDPDLPAFSQLNGRFGFTESGMSARGLSASFLGGPTTISVLTRNGATEIDAQGSASASQVPEAWGGSLIRELSGTTPWRGTLRLSPKKAATLVVQSPLTGLASSLPAPFRKSAAEPLPLRVERQVEAGEQRVDRFAVSLGTSVRAKIERRWNGKQYVLKRGVIGMNEEAVLPEREGILVSGVLPYVDVDRWGELLGAAGDIGSSQSVALKLKIDALDFAHRRLNEVDLRAGTSGDVWVANVSARELAGEIAWRSEDGGRIVARLKRLSLPEPAPGNPDKAKSPRELPALDVIADHLILNRNDLGRLELNAVNKALDWQIEKLSLVGPESTLSVSKGVWQNWALQPSVNLDGIELKVNDLGKFLDRVGFPGTVRGGAATLKGNVSWSGSPQTIDYPTLSGNLELLAERGQFLKADPGAAKLIGILSMQSWVTLDFRELFNRGFAFDAVTGKARIADGVLRTDDFRIKGPSASVGLSGETDLARETQDLRARIEPSVGNSLSVILGVVINPVWGLGSLLLQQVLKNPLAQAFAFEYHVTGTWTDAKAEPLKADVQTSEASQGQAP